MKLKNNIFFLRTKFFHFSLLILLVFFDLFIVVNNFQSDIQSLVVIFFGGIDFTNIKILLVIRYVIIMFLFLYLSQEYLHLSNEKSYMLMLRYQSVEKYWHAKLKKLIYFSIFYLLLLFSIYFVCGYIFLNKHYSYIVYVDTVFNKKISMDFKFILTIVILNFINQINFSLLFFVFKLYIKNLYISILIPLIIIVISIFSQNTILMWSPFSSYMILRFDELTGIGNGFNYESALIINLITSCILIFFINARIVNKKNREDLL